MNKELGYPSEKTLKTIREWKIESQKDCINLIMYVEKVSKYDSLTIDGNTYRYVTSGWSGNEDLIQALSENKIFWLLCWESSHRGGVYFFSID